MYVTQHYTTEIAPGRFSRTPQRRRATQLEPSTALWMNQIAGFRGTVLHDSVRIADQLVKAIKGSGYGQKIVYMLPWLGNGTEAFRTPILDTMRIGPAATTNFVDADCLQSSGCQGGAGKFFNSLVNPAMLNADTISGG